ncbi:MAG: hypothetical protein KGZ39_02645 [Simkania sp.]|nr:hypothetical protein [Simkania sp.]
MASSRALVKYKPLRIGFLVREGSVEDLVKAAGINSLLWGGIYNPILPIKVGDNSLADQLIKLFAIDILYPVTGSEEIMDFKKKYPYLRDTKHYAENIFYEDWHTKKKISGFLDSKNIVDFLWEKDLKNKPKSFKSNFSLVEWEQDDSLANVFALQFGYFPTLPGVDFKWDYKKGFIQGLHAKEEKIKKTDNLDIHPRKSYGPISLTSVELTGYSTGGWSIDSKGIYIGAKDNFNDLVAFWNLRASGKHIVFLAKDDWERTIPFAQKFLDFLNSLPNRHPNRIEDWIVIYSQLTNEEIKELAPKILSKKRFTWSNVSEHSWNGGNVHPEYQIFKSQIVNAHTQKTSDGKYEVTIDLPEKKFLVDDDDSEVAFQQLGVLVDAFGEYSYPGYTLKLPYIRELNEFYSREVVFDPWKLKVGKGGFTVTVSVNEESVNLFPIHKQDLIKNIFSAVKIKAETSQSGLLTTKIIEKIDGLEAARVLKIRGVRMLLEQGTPTSFVSRGEATQIIFNNDFEKHKGLYIESRESKELDSNQVFDYLLKQDFFRAGLELICNQCKLKNWLSLKNIDDMWTCEYCGAKEQTSTHLRSRGDWRFRKSGLFSKDNHQEGAIPVLLTLLTMKRVLDRSNFSYATALKLNGDGIDCETDFCVLEGLREDELEISIGECKSEGGSITKEDCDNLKAVALKLSEVTPRAEIYITFAKTADSFTPEEIVLFKEISKDHNLILFTNRELELYHPYWLEAGEIEEDVPEKYPNSMGDLSRNSVARYLK